VTGASRRLRAKVLQGLGDDAADTLEFKLNAALDRIPGAVRVLLSATSDSPRPPDLTVILLYEEALDDAR